MVFKFFSKNGQILSTIDALIPLQNIEYSYGFGVYESLRVRNGIIYFVKQHLERLFNSAEILGIEYKFSANDIANFINKLLEKEKIESCNIKILLIGGKTIEESLLFIIPLSPLFPDRKLYVNGANTVTFEYERFLPHAKSLNMLGSYLAYKKAKQTYCYDALLIDRNKNIVEGTRTNFFTVKNKTIFTQPREKILLGVTREIVLYIAKKLKFEVKEINIQTNELAQFDSAFLSSTSSKIIPIKRIDEFVFSEISQPLRTLMHEFNTFLNASNGIFNEVR